MSYERRKVKTGRVVSDKMDRTIVVQVEWRSPHRLYKKPIRRMSKFMVHDPDNMSMVGDVVQVIESRPMSKTKRWRLVKILQRSEMVDVRPEDIGEDAQPAVVLEPAVEPDIQMDVVAEPIVENQADVETEAQEDTEPVAGVESDVDAEEAEEDSDPDRQPRPRTQSLRSRKRTRDRQPKPNWAWMLRQKLWSRWPQAQTMMRLKRKLSRQPRLRTQTPQPSRMPSRSRSLSQRATPLRRAPTEKRRLRPGDSDIFSPQSSRQLRGAHH